MFKNFNRVLFQLMLTRWTVRDWNEWRRRNPEVWIDLDRARLDGASLVGASLLGASLLDASLNRARLDGASLLGASLVGARLVGASLDRARLDGASLLGASLLDASLVGASGIIDLGCEPERGYRRLVVKHDDGPLFVAGCHQLTFA